MKALITGVAGFIGSNLADALLEQRFEVYGIDNLRTGKEENIKDALANGLKFVNNDVNYIKGNPLPKRSEKFDVVYHLAALPRVQYSIDEPIRTNKANISGTPSVLVWARKFAKKLVYASSSSAKACKSPYALQKRVGEDYCRMWNNLFNMKNISLRFFNVYGYRMNIDGEYACLIPRHLRLAKENMDLPIFGDGENKRDFTNVDDVVRCLISAGLNEKVIGGTYNVGTGTNYSVNEVSKIIRKVTKSKSKVAYKKAREGEPRVTKADISKTTKAFGWKPLVGLEQGINKCKDLI
ncbi:GDP-mannose 4,6-dehydratase [Patescibacteria group bacterium]|nr:GDP-mannose 4,6-dehydratase [Patescibacteria group bacterium]